MRKLWLPAVTSALIVLAGCASQPESSEAAPQRERATPVPQVVLMKSPESLANPELPSRNIKKDAFAVVVLPGSISANGVKVKDPQALAELLARHNKPLVTLSVHRCVDGHYAKELLASVQSLTDLPIPYSAIGTYTDELCDRR